MEKDKREFALSVIAGIIQNWVDWNIKQRDKENLVTIRNTHVMRVPEWPTVGVLQNWVKVLSAKETGWISVEDRLPEERPHRLTCVLVATTSGAVIEALYNTKLGLFLNYKFKELNHSVTHWMSLPKHPDKE